MAIQGVSLSFTLFSPSPVPRVTVLAPYLRISVSPFLPRYIKEIAESNWKKVREGIKSGSVAGGKGPGGAASAGGGGGGGGAAAADVKSADPRFGKWLADEGEWRRWGRWRRLRFYWDGSMDEGRSE